MVKIFTRPQCAYCPQVKKYLDNKGIPYETFEAEGEEYETIANQFGFSVPLIYNGQDGMTGFDIGKLNRLLGL